MVKDEVLSFAKNCAICVAAGITITIAVKYFKDNDIDLYNLVKKSEYDSYERKILNNLIRSSDLRFTKEDIVGQDKLVNQMLNEVVLPIRYKNRFEEGEIEAARGVLFFGPPGCGKTMLAQAIAKELDVHFINIGLDSIQDKWYGETTKLVKAMFTLAKKIKPCVIFIDEIDSILASRSSEDHEATKGCKSTFLQLWDGLFSSEDDGILIIGATNRRELIDEAFLSRFDYTYHLPLPSVQQRELYLRKALANCTESNFDFKALAERTAGFSFRDLKSLCKQTKTKRIPNIQMISLQGPREESTESIQLRDLKQADFNEVLKQSDKFSDSNVATSSRYIEYTQD